MPVNEEERRRAREWLTRYIGGPGEHRVEMGDVLATYARETQDAVVAWLRRSAEGADEHPAFSRAADAIEKGAPWAGRNLTAARAEKDQSCSRPSHAVGDDAKDGAREPRVTRRDGDGW